MNLRYYHIICFTLLALFSIAQENQNGQQIYIKNTILEPAKNKTAFLEKFNIADQNVVNGRFYKIFQFYEIPTTETKRTFQNAGIDFINYLPKKAFVVSISQSFKKNAPVFQCVRSIIDIEHHFKLSPSFLEKNYPDHAITENGHIKVIASYYPDMDAAMVKQMLQSKGYIINEEIYFGHAFKLEIQITEIEEIVKLPFVAFLEPIGPIPVPDNYTGRTLHRSNVLNSDYSTGRQYDGSGVIVELQDDGIIGPHIDYEGRIIEQFPTNNGGNHGDHCAGILMGAGNIDPTVKGTATGSELYVYNASPSYPGFYSIPDDYENQNVRITSTSYSNGCNIGYNHLARLLDQQVNEYQSLIHVFSAGNDGNSDCNYGAGPGWGNITGGHKMAKNVITVGLVGWDDDLSDMSSRGPAHDGRIKPDIVGKGRDVYSTVDPNTYDHKTGTSMSCPAVAGVCAQLFQAYREIYSGDDPKADLIRTILLNTADDLGNIGPDFEFGFGRINALKAVEVLEESRFLEGSISQGEIYSFDLDIPAGIEQLKLMIAWTDPESSLYSDWTLVNDINMSLTDPSANNWLPWKLSHYPDPDSLSMPAFRGIDDRNNVEQITLNNPAAGIYNVNIEGFAIPEGIQDFAICWEFTTPDIKLTYPIGGESLVPGENEIIRWDAFGNDGSFNIEVSIDNGSNWEVITADLPGDKRFYSWVVPPAITSNALIRISKNSSTSISEAPFSIMGVPCNFQVNWACDESVYLSWNPVMGASSYEVLSLGDTEMEVLLSTTENSIIVEDLNTDSDSWFSVRAIGDNNAIGRRAIAVERLEGNYNCHSVDAKMEAIPTGEWGIYQTNEMDLSNVKVEVVIRNYGETDLIDIPIKYQLGNNEIISETYEGIIEPNELVNYTFNTPIDISAIGAYTIKSWVEYENDSQSENDLLQYEIEVVEGSPINIGYTQNFDSWIRCTSAPACSAISCDLNDAWINLDNSLFDDHDWRVFSGSTPSSFTGPVSDHTTGSADGLYLYVEPSLYCLNKKALLSLPVVDLSGSSNPIMSLWYHAYGADIGQFHIDGFDGNEIIEDICPPILGSRGNQWNNLEVDLSEWAGQKLAIRFRGITSCGELGDFAFDDFELTNLTSVSEHSKTNNSIKLQPNPTNGFIQLSFTDDYIGYMQLRIENIYGSLIRSEKTNKAETTHTQSININSINKGLYLISGIDENGEILFRSKVIKL